MEDPGLLGRDAASLGKWYLTFRKNMSPSSKVEPLTVKGHTFLRNVENHMPGDAASQPRTLESSTTLMFLETKLPIAWFSSYGCEPRGPAVGECSSVQHRRGSGTSTVRCCVMHTQ